MQKPLSLFESVPLPFRCCRIPGPDESRVIRKQPRRFLVNRVAAGLARAAFDHAGFSETRSKLKWNTSWGRQFEPDEYRACQCWQRVSHFAGAWLIGRKDQLHKRMMELRRRTGDFASFYPVSFVLPVDQVRLQKVWRKNLLWIIKPVASSRGRGIRVVCSSHAASPKRGNVVVQTYIANPFLITGRKFDLRLYVLVTSITPFRVYLHQNGLARFATRQYDSSQSATDRCMHLTNFSVNKKDARFVRCGRAESIENSKWSLDFFYHYLDEQGIDTTALKCDIERVTVATILAGMSEVRSFHSRCGVHRPTCYELYGIDILLDSELKPHVMEINISPSLNSKDSHLDFNLKYPMVLDLLRIARIVDCNPKADSPCPALVLLDKAYRTSIDHTRLTQVESKVVNAWDRPAFADFVIVRDFLEEKVRRSGFKRVYPKRKTMQLYEQVFDSMKYCDIVLGSWVAMSPEDRLKVLRRSWGTYVAAMNGIQ
jgi:tubulin polyglutamylase TTLL4